MTRAVSFLRDHRGWAVAALAAAAVALVALEPWESDALHEPSGAWVASGPPRHAVVWAVGDGADGGRDARAVVARMRADGIDRLLYLGDVYAGPLAGLITGDGTAKAYRDRYATTFGALAARTAPTPGNHEWPQRDDGYEPYWRRVTGTTPPAYYAFRAAGWTLLSLNSQIALAGGSPQLRWLRRTVARPGTCRLAFWHRPRFSAGRHGDQRDTAPLFDALRGHAVLVVSGHDHDMQRFRPVGGITQLVSGAGGHDRYPVHDDRRLAFADDRVFGALRIDLRPGRARLRFVAAGGAVLDDSVVRCRQPRSA